MCRDCEAEKKYTLLDEIEFESLPKEKFQKLRAYFRDLELTSWAYVDSNVK